MVERRDAERLGGRVGMSEGERGKNSEAGVAIWSYFIPELSRALSPTVTGRTQQCISVLVKAGSALMLRALLRAMTWDKTAAVPGWPPSGVP